MWLLELQDRRHYVKALIQFRPATLFSLKNRLLIVAQVVLCELPTELLHVMQGFGRRIIFKFLNRYQTLMHFKVFLSIS
jgi:hypothetical protein